MSRSIAGALLVGGLVLIFISFPYAFGFGSVDFVENAPAESDRLRIVAMLGIVAGLVLSLLGATRLTRHRDAQSIKDKD